jgi:mRNA interferase RelE/StbE
VTYAITIHKQAQKKLLSLATPDRHRIAEAIAQLGDDPDDARLSVKKMQGYAADTWRLRVGGWRVIYARDDAVRVIAIERIGARGDVYK